jgi:superfamily II DNA/RNA helicase
LGSDAKPAKLHSLHESEGFSANPDQRLLMFTEFKDTLDYLLSKLTSWGLRAGSIHASMTPGARDIPGSRLFAEQQSGTATSRCSPPPRRQAEVSGI